jgi:hypothetical protein
VGLFAVLVKYTQNLPRVNNNLKSVKILEHIGDGGVRMAVTSDFCVLTDCLTFRWNQVIETRPDGDIVMAIVPGQGDF